jgi:hypothetical protein
MRINDDYYAGDSPASYGTRKCPELCLARWSVNRRGNRVGHTRRQSPASRPPSHRPRLDRAGSGGSLFTAHSAENAVSEHRRWSREMQRRRSGKFLSMTRGAESRRSLSRYEGSSAGRRDDRARSSSKARCLTVTGSKVRGSTERVFVFGDMNQLLSQKSLSSASCASLSINIWSSRRDRNLFRSRHKRSRP